MQRQPSKYKQVFVVRKDLAMDAGKLGSQTAHAVHLAMLGDLRPAEGEPKKEKILITLEGAAAEWIQEDYPKITLEVYSEDELLDIHAKAKAAGLPCGLVVDNGWTVFKNQKTHTVVGIGPADASTINAITGHLKKYSSAKEAQ
jgi:PTH2 family peptidyl-tRNA hydrolase